MGRPMTLLSLQTHILGKGLQGLFETGQWGPYRSGANLTDARFLVGNTSVNDRRDTGFDNMANIQAEACALEIP